jgi:Rieske Fe-S protein
MPDDPDRRKFLKLATCGVGAGLGAAIGLPTLSLVIDPATKQTVTTPTEPIDLGDPGRLGPGWQRLDVVAPVVRDGWNAAQNVILGAAWVRNHRNGIEALSAVCPHLGCAVGWQSANNTFLCACHDSVFADDGKATSGPAKRGLDPLPIAVKDGRLRLTWIRYQLDTASREPA